MSFVKRVNGLSGAKKALLAACAIALVSLAAYSNTFEGEFHFDDYHQIVDNPAVRDIDNLAAFFTTPGLASSDERGSGYRPVTLASFAVSYAVSGTGVWSYHAFNLALHALVCFMVFLSVGAVLSGPGQGGGGEGGGEGGGGGAFFAPFVAALVFAAHPLQTAAVSYISGRAVLLSSLFYLFSFYLFVRYRKAGPAARGYRAYLPAAAAPVLFFFGLLSKEMAASLVFVMLAYDLIFTVPARGGLGRSIRAFYYYVPFAAALGVYLLIKNSMQGFVAVPVKWYGKGEYLMSEAKTLLLYLRLLVLPVNQNADYVAAPTSSPDVWVVLAVLLVTGSLYLLYRLRAREPAAAFFGLWFFLALAPESTLVPILDIAVEYRLYLPSVGFIAASVVLLRRPLSRPGVPAVAARGFAAAVVCMLALMTFSRNAVWATELSLWSDVMEKSPHSTRAYANVGVAYYEDGRYDEAIKTYLKLKEMDPGYTLAYYNLALSYLGKGMADEALGYMRKAASLAPGNYDVRHYLAVIYEETGAPDKARAEAALALKLASDGPQRAEAELLVSRLGGAGENGGR